MSMAKWPMKFVNNIQPEKQFRTKLMNLKKQKLNMKKTDLTKWTIASHLN